VNIVGELAFAQQRGSYRVALFYKKKIFTLRFYAIKNKYKY